MKRLFSAILFFAILISAVGCTAEAPEIEDSTYYVGYTIDRIEYETSDGVWYRDTVHQMISKYFEEKVEAVSVTVKLTFTADEDFHYADLTVKGGVGNIRNSVSFDYQVYNKTLGSVEPGGDLIGAGQYTIVMESVSFCFYKYRKVMLSPYPRDMMNLITELNVIRHNV